MADDLATPTSDQLEFDANDLRAKYQAERDKRLRAEGDTAWIGRVVDDILSNTETQTERLSRKPGESGSVAPRRAWSSDPAGASLLGA